MKGSNSITLCPEAMREAVEYYLNNSVLYGPHDVKVTNIYKSKGRADTIIRIVPKYGEDDD